MSNRPTWFYVHEMYSGPKPLLGIDRSDAVYVYRSDGMRLLKTGPLSACRPTQLECYEWLIAHCEQQLGQSGDLHNQLAAKIDRLKQEASLFRDESAFVRSQSKETQP